MPRRWCGASTRSRWSPAGSGSSAACSTPSAWKCSVTVSSTALLSREVATALRGRAWQVVVQPFSFEEALRHGGRPIPEEPAFLTPRERSHMERAMLDWLQEGGFPEAQGLDVPSRYQLLRDYVDVAVLRDVVERHGVRNVVGLRALVRHLLEGIPGRSWPDPTVRSNGAGKRWTRAGDRGTGRVGTAAVRCDVRSDHGRVRGRLPGRRPCRRLDPETANRELVQVCADLSDPETAIGTTW